MQITGHLPAALLLLLHTTNALPYASSGDVSTDYLAKRVAAGDQAGVLDGLLADKPKLPAPKTEDELRLRLATIWGSSSTNFYAGIKAQIDANISLSDI